MRRAVATIPGVEVSFGQPISHRIDHMISGSRTNLAVKVFGPDLAVLRGLAGARRDALAEVPGIVDLSNQEQAAIPQLVIDFDRAAMAHHGLSPAAVSQAVEAMFQGVEVGEIVEQGITSRVVVRFPEGARRARAPRALPVTTPAGRSSRCARSPSPFRPRPVDGPARERPARGDAHRQRGRRRSRRHGGARARRGRPRPCDSRPGIRDLRWPVRGGQPRRPQPGDPRWR